MTPDVQSVSYLQLGNFRTVINLLSPKTILASIQGARRRLYGQYPPMSMQPQPWLCFFDATNADEYWTLI